MVCIVYVDYIFSTSFGVNLVYGKFDICKTLYVASRQSLVHIR